MSLVTLPYIGVLLLTLPNRVVSHNYRLTWVGFDLLLVLAMTRTAWLAWRRSPFVVNVASATATLLVVDAWFDVTTSPRHQVWLSFLLAVFVEIPVALLSLAIASRAQIQIARTGAVRPHGEARRLMQRYVSDMPEDSDVTGGQPDQSAGQQEPGRPWTGSRPPTSDLPGSSESAP